MPPSFWNVNIGQVVTAGAVFLAWLITKIWDARGVKDAVETVRESVVEVSKRQDAYTSDLRNRDALLQTLEKTVVVLQTLADTTDRRLRMLEEIYLETVAKRRLGPS